MLYLDFAWQRLRSSLGAPLLVSWFAAAGGAQTILHELPGENMGDRFGSRLATGGDVDGDGVPDVLVSAMSFDGPAQNSGRVLLLSGADLSLLRTFDGWHADQGFGFSLAFVGDVDGDGADDVLIGARWDGAMGHEAGAAHLYSGASGDLIRSFHATHGGIWFGNAVAGLGDIDGDGVPDVAVAGDRLHGGASRSGVVVAFSGATGAVLHTWEGNRSLMHFGSSLATLGDLDGDGVPDLAIGASGDRTIQDREGSVQVFSGATGSLILRVEGVHLLGLLGSVVAALGDVDGDGVPDFAAGGHNANISGSSQGHVRVYSGASGTLLYELVGAQVQDRFGATLAGGGDLDLDGVPDLLVGAAQDNSIGGGRVIAFSGADGRQLFEMGFPATTYVDATSLAWTRDWTGDGRPELLLGRPSQQQNTGALLLVAPCEGAATYCESKVSSLGCTPILEAPGPLSVAGSPLVVEATQVLNRTFGIAFWGKAPLHQPLYGGFLCILPPLYRSVPVFSGGSAWPEVDCSGTLEIPISATELAAQGLLPGARFFMQAWYRDSDHPDGTGIGLTNGVEISICP